MFRGRIGCPWSVLTASAIPLSGCYFHPRCGSAVERCVQEKPDLWWTRGAVILVHCLHTAELDPAGALN